MTTELATQEGSTGTVNVAPPEPTPLQLVAVNQAEMKEAQRGLCDWFFQRLELARRDQQDAEENHKTAKEARFTTASFWRQVSRARKITRFYEKCLAAVEAGYLIVPDMDVDVFAIRTAMDQPKRRTQTNSKRWYLDTFLAVSESPALGEGGYVADELPRKITEHTRENEEGEEETFYKSEMTEYAGVDFPLALATPVVMNATQEAMAKKIFDQIGGLPHRRTKGRDPIVVGRILRPDSTRHLSFLIAWWIDTREL